MVDQARELAARAGELARRREREAAEEIAIGRILDEGLARGPLDEDETLPTGSRFAAAPDGWSADFGIRSTLPH